MKEMVHDGVGDRGLSDLFLPGYDRELRREDRRAGLVAVVEDIEKILPLFRGAG